MVLEAVAPSSSEIEHLASVDVKFSGAHIGGGIFFSANHNPSPGGASVAVPQSSLDGEVLPITTTELDFTLPVGGEPWDAYRDIDGDPATTDFVKTGFDISLHVGAPVDGGGFYSGPSVPLLIANDPTDLLLGAQTATITGYPNRETDHNGDDIVPGEIGELHQSSGILSNYFEQDVGSDDGGWIFITGAEAVGGMSGGPVFIDYDPDGDGTADTFIVGSVVGVNDLGVAAASFSPHYADLAAAIEGLTGDAARTADDFPRMTLLSAQSLGSSLTTVQGQFFHEDIYGGPNPDTLLGAGGDDALYGGAGADSLDGGSGSDTLEGGDGADTMIGGSGADWFSGMSFGDGSTDVVADFEAGGGDVIDLSSYFATLDDVLASTSDLGDGSILITLPLAMGGGAIQVLDTSSGDLTALNVNVVCFTPGTHVLTANGEREITRLRPGDLVVTISGQLKPLIAIHKRDVGLRELRDRPKLWPIEISAGALGPNIPERTLRVSPQHRVLTNSLIAVRMVQGPALVAAKNLLGYPGVAQPQPSDMVTYIHLILDQHEVIRSDGCWSESFFPGDQAMAALPEDIKTEYAAIFVDNKDPAAVLLTGKKARRLRDRHLKNAKALQNALRSGWWHKQEGKEKQI